MSISSTSSPERYCLGGLMKDIDKETFPKEDDFCSKEQTSYHTIKDQKLSLDSVYSFRPTQLLFFPKTTKKRGEDKSEKCFIKTLLSALDDQKSTIQLQKSLMEAPKEVLNNIIKEMSGYFRTIIKNKNGNYYCSDLFKVCDKNQRIQILKEISSFLSEDCVDEYGNHPIQTLIDISCSQQEYELLLNSFGDYNHILKAAMNQNGTYVIQKLIVHIPEKFRINFNFIFLKCIPILAMDMYGVCSVIKFLNHTKNEIIEKFILNLVLSNFVYISDNKYGNYLIQNILELWWNTNKGLYLKKMCIDQFHILALNHYSSFVCDMFIKLSSLEDKKSVMSILSLRNINLFNCSDSAKIVMSKLTIALKKKDGNNYKKNNKNLLSKKKKDK